MFRSLLKYTTACYLRDFDAVKELKPYVDKCEFFMDTSYFAYDWNNVRIDNESKIKENYVVVNLNKNAEWFFDELVKDISLKNKYQLNDEEAYIDVKKVK